MAGFDHQRLYDGEYVCVMRKGHPLSRGPLSLARYCNAHHLLVSFSGRPFGFIDEALASLGRKRRIVLTVLPRHFVKVTGMTDEITLRELPFEVPRVHVDSLWHRRQEQRSDHAWLRLAVAAAATKAFAADLT